RDAHIYSFDTCTQCNEVQKCADAFYKIVNSLLDSYYPSTFITLTNQDPTFITPEIKSLLRKKNSLMRKGKTEHANAIATKIGTIVVRNNASKLSYIKPSDGTKDLWNEVNRLTKKGQNNNQSSSSTFHSVTLNSHYAAISSGNNYIEPRRKA